MKKIIIALFFVLIISSLLNGQTTPQLITEKTYSLKNIPSPQDIAWDGANFWVIDNFTFTLYKLSADFEDVDTSIYLHPRDCRDLAFDGQYFWVVDNTFNQVLKINKNDYHDIGALSLPAAKFISGITCDGTDIYISWEDGWCSQIAKVVPGTDSISFVTFTKGANVTGLTKYNDQFYYCYVDQTPRIVGVSFPPILYTFPKEISLPSDLEIISGYIWVLDFASKTLYKLKADTTTSGITEPVIPEENNLNQNYPNPFNPSTTIGYNIREANFVTLKIYDPLGKEKLALVNKYQNSGNYKIEINASQLGLSSGVYFYVLTAGHSTIVKKMILIK